MRAGAFSTPRPAPARLLPSLAASAVVGLALPVFVLAGWPLAGWLLGALLWVGAQGITALVARTRLGASNLARTGVVGVGMMFRAVAVMVVVIAVAAGDAAVGLAAALVYALAYTLELGLSLASYFGGAAR